MKNDSYHSEKENLPENTWNAENRQETPASTEGKNNSAPEQPNNQGNDYKKWLLIFAGCGCASALLGCILLVVITAAIMLLNNIAMPSITNPEEFAAFTPVIKTPAVELATEQPVDRTAPIKVCEVTDMGGIDDRTYNQIIWKGVQDAMNNLGVEGKYLDSRKQSDYEKNINTFLEEDCDLIVTVAILLSDATSKAAENNPDQKFAIVDYAYDPGIPNVLGMVFSVDQASYMAGYLAAGMSKTGKIGVYSGIQLPALEPFLTGFVLGARAYNEKHGADIEVLGWNPETRTGLFTGNFDSLEDGRRMGETLLDEGADIIFPVAGPCGLGTAEAIQRRGGAYIIGADTDMVISSPEYEDIILTSVLKNMDTAVYETIQQMVDGTFRGGDIYIGTVANGGVGLAPYHKLDSKVPEELKNEMQQLAKDIAEDKVVTW